MNKAVLAAVLMLGIVLRLGYAAWVSPSQFDSDERDYAASAIALLDRASFEETVRFHVPPATPLLYAMVFGVLGRGNAQIWFAQAFLFAAIGVTIYLLGTGLAGKTAGLLAVLFAALYPYFIYFSGLALSETAGVLAISAMLVVGVRAARNGRWQDCLGFGALVAIAALTRAAVFYFVLAVPLVFAIAWGVRSGRWVKASALALAGFLVLYLPWTAVNYRAFGEFIPTPTIGSGVMLYQTALRLTIPDEAERLTFLRREILPRYYEPPGASHHDRLAGDRYLQREGKRIIAANIGGYPEIAWQNFLRFWQFYPNAPEGETTTRRVYRLLGLGSYGVLFPLFVLGLWLGRHEFRRLAVLYGFLCYFTLVHCLVYGKLRYRIPMDGVILAFSASGALWVAERLVTGRLHVFERWLAGKPAAQKGN